METKKPKRKFRLWIKLLVAFILTILILLLYSRFIATSGLVIKEYLVKDENLPEAFYGLKIAHLSDIHYGQTTHIKEIKKIVQRVNETEPDIIVITGDLLDRDMTYSEEDLTSLEKELSKLEASLGKYIIMGNHDFTRDEYNTVISNIGFTNLDDTYQILYKEGMDSILIAGVSTGQKGSGDFSSKVEDALLKIEETSSPYNILILHEPDYIEDFDASKFQLILAGHSHNGQVRFPFLGAVILPPHAKKYYDNYYDLGKSKLYISSGIGTSTIKFRFCNRPSFNLYRLVNQ